MMSDCPFCKAGIPHAVLARVIDGRDKGQTVNVPTRVIRVPLTVMDKLAHVAKLYGHAAAIVNRKKT